MKIDGLTKYSGTDYRARRPGRGLGKTTNEGLN